MAHRSEEEPAKRGCAAGGTSAIDYAVVVATLCRPSLRDLLAAIVEQEGPPPAEIVIVDDRPAGQPCQRPVTETGGIPARCTASGGRGPAAARNVGWRTALAHWVVFLDDDVVPTPDWRTRLADDLLAAGPDVVAVQGRIDVPLPSRRRLTDWERATAGLASARWATADMAYRRAALAEVGGFDERFPRAYREDADLGLRAQEIGHIVLGRREVQHPVRPARWTASVARQAGNADDALMGLIHGPGWRDRAGAPAGRRRRHAAVTAAGALALGAGAVGRRRLATLGAVAWTAGTAELAWARIAPGPRNLAEVTTMIATSTAIPPVAVGWWLAGMARHAGRRGARTPGPTSGRAAVGAVLFDRDGTLVEDVPYNGDPALVRPRPGAVEAVQRVRSAGLPIGLVSNQSGVGTGRITLDEMKRVNRRTAELLGPFDTVQVCTHAPTDGCRCRKPAPQMVLDAAAALGVEPERCVIVGDIGSDVAAAHAAGARAVLVPTDATRGAEIAMAPIVATDVEEAVAMILAGQVR